jgi:hypothetical protein
MSFATPFLAPGACEGAPQRFSIWLAGSPDCRHGFETVDNEVGALNDRLTTKRPDIR